MISSDDFLVARVPPGASSGPIVVSTNGHSSNPHQLKVAVPIADESASRDQSGARPPKATSYVTFSGSRGQKVPVSIFRLIPTTN